MSARRQYYLSIYILSLLFLRIRCACYSKRIAVWKRQKRRELFLSIIRMKKGQFKPQKVADKLSADMSAPKIAVQREDSLSH